MKRIIDGVTYNSDTSTLCGESEYETEYNHVDQPCTGYLYMNRGGAFFVHEQIGKFKKDRFRALSRDDALAWWTKGEVEVFSDPFGEPPEAEAEDVLSSTLYVRVPITLKQAVERAASAERMSGNAWTIRCVERCLGRKSAEQSQIANAAGIINKIWHLTSMIRAIPDGYEAARLREVCARVADEAEDAWKALGGTEDGLSDSGFAPNAEETPRPYEDA